MLESGVDLPTLAYLAMKASGPTALRVCLDYLWFTGGVTTGSRVQLNWGSHPKHSMKSNSEWTVDINKDGWQIFTSYYSTGARAKIAKKQRLPSWHCDWICTPGTGWWSLGIPNSKHNLNKHKMYCGKWKKEEEGCVVTHTVACHQGSDLCFD